MLCVVALAGCMALVLVVHAGAQPGATADNPPSTASFTAVDYAWNVTGTNQASVTIATGGTVTFGYPTGASFHNVDFSTPPAAPICMRTDGKTDAKGNPPLPRNPAGPGWTGQCTFNTAGTYNFTCDAHPTQMQATIIVQDAGSSNSSSSSASSTASTTSSTTTATSTVSTSETTTTTTLTSSNQAARPGFANITVKGSQRGPEVTGAVNVIGGTRLDVSLAAKRASLAPASRSSATVTVAAFSKRPVAPGSVSFALIVARKPAHGHTLALVMTLQLTAANGTKVTRQRSVTVTFG